jgi:2-polyprenyl-3-methyl-5-hydroxy-6-metoxy-1,4-benzoquinol methylase
MAFLAALARRERIPELMDDPGLNSLEHRLALQGLARLNRFSGSTEVLWKPLVKFARGRPGQTIRVLDVATGSGDVPIGLWRKAKAAGIPLVAAGCDISPTAVKAAAIEAAEAGAPVTFFVHDALREPLPTGYDVVACSLFLHHLSRDDAVSLLRRMAEAAGSLVLVNDLARSRFNYLAVWLACRALSRSRVVRYDGPASVRSAFAPPEAMRLAQEAGLSAARVQVRFPCRYLLQWTKGKQETKSEIV